MFEKTSRYSGLQTYLVTDHRGRTVAVLPVPEAPQQAELGLHLRRQGQRLDHLAYRYLDDSAGYWRICELNEVMQAEMLSEADETAIPRKER